MPATWFYVVGGIVIGILVFTIAYYLISVSIRQTQKQSAISNFNNLHTNLEMVCLQEINNSMTLKLKISNVVRVIYTTNDTVKPLSTVVYNITNRDTWKEKILCMQFHDEQTLRCKELTCNVSIPYMGSLPESMDIRLFVKKILGQAPVKEYELVLRKSFSDEVEVIIGEELY